MTKRPAIYTRQGSDGRGLGIESSCHTSPACSTASMRWRSRSIEVGFLQGPYETVSPSANVTSRFPPIPHVNPCQEGAGRGSGMDASTAVKGKDPRGTGGRSKRGEFGPSGKGTSWRLRIPPCSDAEIGLPPPRSGPKPSTQPAVKATMTRPRSATMGFLILASTIPSASDPPADTNEDCPEDSEGTDAASLPRLPPRRCYGSVRLVWRSSPCGAGPSGPW